MMVGEYKQQNYKGKRIQTILVTAFTNLNEYNASLELNVENYFHNGTGMLVGSNVLLDMVAGNEWTKGSIKVKAVDLSLK